MADAPLRLADIQVSAALTENWGRPTSYFQRYLQDNNNRITASIVGVQTALDELALQQAELTAQQATLTAQQAQLTAQAATLTAQVARLNRVAGVGFWGAILTDGSGAFSYTHGGDPGAGYTMQYSHVYATGTTPYIAQMTSVDDYVITGIFFDLTGAPVASTYVPCSINVAAG